MKHLILVLLVTISFLLGLRLSGVVSKFAPYLVGSREENVTIPQPGLPVDPMNPAVDQQPEANQQPQVADAAVNPQVENQQPEANQQPQAVPAPAGQQAQPNAPVAQAEAVKPSEVAPSEQPKVAPSQQNQKADAKSDAKKDKKNKKKNNNK
ncbi:hypothetical protein [Candidatus Deianiraea vastatrix]|uniref:Uncharacterized protein n=1 Tax=Candidatus Deianiraea vastatrix TaxID=2163644 RepID=A0A5B8XDV7_9RICK|nr:hypothetical protein [Candidatus Deianiraea vastatrix]QED23498.1 hypothetical protein Deia_00707 [Candidatus Deianiraea vastatrix]